MIRLVALNHDKIVALCKKHHVRRLELFGSAARADDFDPDVSDIDFLWSIDKEREFLVNRFFGFKEDLESLLGRNVDLVDIEATTNPYFWQIANRCRIPLYDS